MSTSFVYHAMGVRTYRYLKTAYLGGAVYFHLTKKRPYQRCVACGSRDVTLEGANKVTVRSLPIGSKATYLVLVLHILRCRHCGAVRQESRDVAEPRKSYTKALKRYVLELARRMNLKDLQRHLGLGWDLLKSIVKDDLKRRERRRSWRKVRRIAIDEIAIRKGQRYMTVVLDLDTGRVLFSAEGRDHSCLEPFFRRLRRSRATLQAIAVDMSNAYIKAIRLWAPADVTVVFDRFHVIALMNRVLDDVRRAELKRLSSEGHAVLKGARYLLLYGIENLAQKSLLMLEKLKVILHANKTLFAAYILKEKLRDLWSLPDRAATGPFLDRWLEEAHAVSQPDLSRLANTIGKHRDAILAYYDEPITTGPLEGLNNKLKVLKRVAYGYRDLEFFRLRVLFIHEVGPKMVGV